MKENGHSSDILKEIFESAKEPALPPQQRPRFEYPPEDGPLPPPPPSGDAPKGGAPFHPALSLWLSVGLGAALLALGICVIQLARLDGRLDSLQESISGELGSVEQLRQENDGLLASRDLLRERVKKAEEGTENLRQEVQSLEQQAVQNQRHVTALNTAWFVRQFVEHGDLHMAAAAVETGIVHFNFLANYGIPLNPAVRDQFERDYLPLLSQGYLAVFSGGYIGIDRAGKFQDDEKTEALLALWSALEGYYCNPASGVSHDFPIEHFSLFGGAQYSFLRENCSEFALQQYQRIVDGFVENGALQWEDGQLAPGPNYTGAEISYGTYQ